MGTTDSAAAFAAIFDSIKRDDMNAAFTTQGVEPLYRVSENARIVIVGQAPGRIAQETRTVWNDKSGDRLRSWLGVDRATFYGSDRIAVMPMDFYFPGAGKSGDLPPRKGFAEKWHPQLLALMPDVQLKVLVGSYAVRGYLHLGSQAKLTDVVRDYQRYLPACFPVVHPSPRNQIWMRKNPWFEKRVVPDLRKRIAALL